MYADPIHLQPPNGKISLSPPENGNVLKSNDNQSDQGYATLSQRNGHPAAHSNGHPTAHSNGHPSQHDNEYATLSVTQLDPVDAKRIELEFDPGSQKV